jgi:dGTPase
MSAPYSDHDVERRVAETPKAEGIARAPFARDRARVLHSAALRRLAAKTQVVGIGVDDFPRTRLTHSLECAQIGRELADALGCDADLVDMACLAHDLGHPPFGHNGETALDEVAASCGGFEGNAQSLRVLTRLEVKVPGAGLNLTRAALDATAKYPWSREAAPPGIGKYGAYDDDLPAFEWIRDGVPGADRRCLEAQVMDWADDIAYSVHDMEDGVQAGLIDPARLMDDDVAAAVVASTTDHYSEVSAANLTSAWENLTGQPWWPTSYDATRASAVTLKAAASELIARFCTGAVEATRAAMGSPEPIRRYDADLVVPPEVRAECALLKGVTAHFVMWRPEALARQEHERAMLVELVDALHAGAPGTLDPVAVESWHEADGDGARLRVVIDVVAGLTDTSARRLWSALTGRDPVAARM